MRLDKWLWAARLFKTRSLAQQAISAGQVKLNEERTKPAHAVAAGDAVDVRKGDMEWRLLVKALSEQRRSASLAGRLYEESPESRAGRERRLELKRYAAEPAANIKGRPTKKERRSLDRLRGSGQ